MFQVKVIQANKEARKSLGNLTVAAEVVMTFVLYLFMVNWFVWSA